MFSQMEESVMNYWINNDIFKKTLIMSEQESNGKTFNFMMGPPFCTGSPHYGHILASLIKDSVLRYYHNMGYHIPRKMSYDTHGLPIEQEIDKLYGIRTTEQVKQMGIDNYNNACRDIVMRCSDDWKYTLTRLGKWIDLDNPQMTMSKNYMNSVWWVFKQLYNKNLIYEGDRIMPYSLACGTPLSNFETQQNYKEIQDDSLYVKFNLKNPLIINTNIYHDVKILVWTTTPWTLPSNYALCVNPNIDYILIQVEETKYIIAMNLLSKLITTEYTILETFKGELLRDLEYHPLFNYVMLHHNNEFVHKIIIDEFVSDSDGTGIVHIAPAYGLDDHRVCLTNDIITKNTVLFQPLNENGFVKDIDELNGLFYKLTPEYKKQNQNEQNIMTLNTHVVIELKKSNNYYKKEQITHNYPHCWRTDTQLIYRAVKSWFVRVESVKDRLVDLNKNINWVPNNIGEARFHNWLSNAKDWGVSRSRFWGCPIPIWKSDDGDVICVGSSYELEELTGMTEGSITDLHLDSISHIIINKNNKVYKLDGQILDCWFESGSMPYCSVGDVGIVELLKNSNSGIEYEQVENNQMRPYITTKDNKKHYILPADFISEGLDQTRGWFYTLLVLSTCLFDMIPFKNVIVNGLVLASDGKKFSKRLKNYQDPLDTIREYGSDSIRLYLLSSPAVKAEEVSFSTQNIHEMTKKVLIQLSSTISFFNEYNNLYNHNHNNKSCLSEITNINITNPINIWIINSYQKMIHLYNQNMMGYNLKEAVEILPNLIDIINNGYIKFGREQIKGNCGDDDWIESLNVLYWLIKRLLNDFKCLMPFFIESKYLELKDKFNDSDEFFRYESIHMITNNNYIFENIDVSQFTREINTFDTIQDIIKTVYKFRGGNNLSMKKPLNNIIININNGTNNLDIITEIIEDKIISECNVLKCDINYDLVINKNIKPLKHIFFKKYKSVLNTKKINELFNEITSKTNKELIEIINNKNYNNLEFDESLFEIKYDYSSCSDNITIMDFTSGLLIIDKTYNDETDMLYYYRLVATKIQRVRQKAGLHPWNQINIYWNGDPKYPLDSDKAIEYIQNIIRVNNFEKYDENINNTFDIFYDQILDDIDNIKILIQMIN